MRLAGCDDGRPEGGQLPAARDEIGVEMRLHCKRHPQVEVIRKLQVGVRVPRGVQDQRPTIAEGHQVGGVSQALVDKGHDLRAVDPDGRPAHQVAGLRPPIRM